LDSSFINYDNSCYFFKLQWIAYIDDLRIETISIKDDNVGVRILKGKDYCSDLKRIDKLNKKKLKKKDIYGIWFFYKKTIGNKYVIITGEKQLIQYISKFTIMKELNKVC
jgi:hypothetical protein